MVNDCEVKVTLHTNKSGYENDIADVIRAFLGFAEICTGKYDGANGYALEVLLSDNQALARGKNGAGEYGASYPFEYGDESALIRKRREKRAAKMAAYSVMRKLEPEVSLPWGALTGIRPTKLYRELIETEGELEALRLFSDDFEVKPEKLELVRRILGVQGPILEGIGQKDADVYIGIPYCASRCLYCSFASQTVGDGVPREYLDALYEDIRMGARIATEGGYSIRSLYVGGGTPTVLSAYELERLISHALCCYGAADKELTVEAGRPDTVDSQKLKALMGMGVTRISLNPQSMKAETLERIGRNHTPDELICAYGMARDIGFDNINMDVIAGLPGETPNDMEYTLEQLARLKPDSLTVHTLAIKRSSLLKESMDAYPLPTPNDAELMAKAGAHAAYALDMQPYYMYRQKYMQGNLENVGYAKKGKECIYNIDMMEEAASILAHGAGAMTKRVFMGRDLRVERIPSPKDITTYTGKLNELDRRKRELFL